MLSHISVSNVPLAREHLKIITLLCDAWPYLDGMCFDMIVENFINGDCYVFSKTVQLIIPETKLRIDLEKAHVVVELDGILFDAVRLYSNGYGREFINERDDEYCIYNFGYNSDFPQDSVFKIVSWVHNFCRNNLSVEQILKIDERLTDYINMCNRLDIDETEWEEDMMFIREEAARFSSQIRKERPIQSMSLS